MIHIFQNSNGSRAKAIVLLVGFACLLFMPSSVFATGEGHIAFVSNRSGNNEIYVMNPDGTGVANLTNNAASDRLPAGSASGSKIAFRSNRNGNSEVYVMNSDGSDVVRLTFNSAVDTSPNWTPDGKVLFSSNRSGRFELYVVNADGSDLQHLE